jgi:Tfp pilus assembly protein PilX
MMTLSNLSPRISRFPDRRIPVVSRTALKQRGVVLFFTLVALLVMSLAAVALIRSVDTGAMIAGNLAFRQASTTAADAGIESAMVWLTTTSQVNGHINMMNNTPSVHPFNVDAANLGYYSSVNPDLSLTDINHSPHINWTDADSVFVGEDSSGNRVRYVIQRMCRDANQPTQNTPCLYGTSKLVLVQQNVPYPQDICDGEGCPPQGLAPMLRITVRSEGLRDSISYVQAFVH